MHYQLSISFSASAISTDVCPCDFLTFPTNRELLSRYILPCIARCIADEPRYVMTTSQSILRQSNPLFRVRPDYPPIFLRPGHFGGAARIGRSGKEMTQVSCQVEE
ncbi:hypothetical protein G7K_1200-t1 [Saitoella complicata NRRL Y-17804]|uniref:Uncharacterized protein n=1 Tax=Saitoella complicata (strain BCRC 22490 / CBS 7301 / JCM 7358 / NBRC 10748 / NRRL Y-17804) TaxID=698492 RepID=A0A0E9NBB6_SAICN|nr:hypothetical protein G7K_1200-t1 [Saitoella complicata NRRL Y-17804]